MEFSGQYLSYNDYRLLGGTLDQMPFNLLEFEARKKIDGRTQGRLRKAKEIPQEVKLCVNALINSIVSYSTTNENVNNKGIISESVGSYSVSYATGSQIEEIINSKNAELNDIITTYLTGVIVNNEHVLFLGVR